MRYRLLSALVALAFLVSGCLLEPQPSPRPTSPPQPRPTATPTSPPQASPPPTFTPLSEAEPTPTTAATPAPPAPSSVEISGPVPAAFASYEPYPVQVEPAVPDYSTDPAQVANPDLLLALTQEQQAHVARDGFVVVPSGPQQMYALYVRAKDAGIPVLVTTDALLHAFHVLYDYTLRSVELDHLMADLQNLTRAMLEAALDAQGSASSDELREAARRNVAYFAVATVLLDPAATAPPAVAELVSGELQLIEAHAGLAVSPIFGYREDYSQYVPRGHYTRNEAFERYFRCMMWYGRMGFHPTTRDETQARRETRQAMMIAAALSQAAVDGEQAIDVWERIYEPTAFFVGQADDLTPDDYQALSQSLFGSPLGPDVWADLDKVDAFRQATRTLRPPGIVSQYVEDRDQTLEETRAFRFMGQRFVYDSYLFQQLVYDKVGPYQGSGQPFTASPSAAGPIRGVPRGLDVAAVFGSDRALAILEVEGDTQYQGYDEQMAKLRRQTLSLPPEQWVSNLYWGWLYSLRPLLSTRGAGYPAFMRSQAWGDKGLLTFLGSWTELRHDTILYAKQSYTVKATSIQPEQRPAPGYVEPQPEVYARLAALARQMQAGLGERGLLRPEFAAKLSDLQDLLLRLKSMSEKELTNRPLDDAELDLIRDIGQTLDRLTTFTEATEQGLSSQADESMAIVADVHTDTNSEQVLEEGIGQAFTLYAVVPHGAGTQAVMGAVLSQYEFRHPMAERLTDEAWQDMARPPLAPWTSSFVVPE